jgi:hypothetical protein
MSRELAARVDEFEFLTDQGVPATEAALRAGWPTVEAAEIALRRAGRPCTELMTEVSRRRHRSEPKHVSEVMGEFVAGLAAKAGRHG